MIVIKIDRKTIRKNPNAGNTLTLIPGRKEVTFVLPLYKDQKEPDVLMHPSIIITDVEFVDGVKIICGQICEKLTTLLMEELNACKDIKIDINRDINKIEHFPEAEYFYEYEKIKIKCEHCGEWVDPHLIERDEFDEYNNFSICPFCETINSFPEFRYEIFSEIREQVV